MRQPTQAITVAKARPEGARWLRWMGAAGFALTTLIVCAVTPADLQPAVVEELRRAGIVSSAAPVPAFRWTVENKRPMRHVRMLEERFEHGPEGLSAMSRTTTYSDGRVDRDQRVSARGLLRLDRDDQSMGVTLEGLEIPPRSGEHFSLSAVRDGTPVRQTCYIGKRSRAKELFAGLPGDVLAIDCTGEGKYAGLNVRVSSRIAYFERLGVFLNSVDTLDTPLGKFTNSNRIVDFELEAP